MIVVDASVIVSALVGGSASVRVTDRIRHEHLVAPDILDVEVVSALRALWLRRTIFDAHLHAAADDLAQLEIDRRPTTLLVPAIVHHRSHLSAYDASYVALAEALDCTLVTLDARMGNAPGVRCVREVLH